METSEQKKLNFFEKTIDRMSNYIKKTMNNDLARERQMQKIENFQT